MRKLQFDFGVNAFAIFVDEIINSLPAVKAGPLVKSEHLQRLLLSRV
jgi:hypothetical protein